MQRFLRFFGLLTAVLLLSSCGSHTVSVTALMDEFCMAYGSMPAGKFYHSSAREWEAGYLSHALSDALFLEENGENALSLCSEYAIFLSSSFGGGEIAFLTCQGQADADGVA